ncbi:hypothetical protein FNL55_13535 [Tardiphaga sp. vice352]|uniref:hypothetical protein n=1 Tax=Tardiphaga sp. vice352 TaxID=2592816 RepID=UPI0011625038|nr:hypothetical protein [Tardiphaga sp. vice352]QDM32251.1 hypothetical protein FNL55_13535 [Tardiphaga sp. vice352]
MDPEDETAGFEQLWQAFPRKHQRSKAKAAYETLAPDAQMHRTLVARAVEWSDHYRTTDTERRWWKHLHSWLAEERYLEDLPVPYENPKEAAIAKSKESAPKKTDAKPKTGQKSTGLSPKTPIGPHAVTIIGSEMPDDAMATETRVRFSYRIEGGEHDGKEFSHTFKQFSDDEDEQTAGQSIFANLRIAAGNEEIDDTSDLHGITLRATVGPMGRVTYAPL